GGRSSIRRKSPPSCAVRDLMRSKTSAFPRSSSATQPSWAKSSSPVRAAMLSARNGTPKARWDLDESSSRLRVLFGHDLFGKPLHTFPDHALVVVGTIPNPRRVGMKIFLAGATGVIGRRLARLLRNDRHDVAGTTRTSAKATLLRE